MGLETQPQALCIDKSHGIVSKRQPVRARDFSQLKFP